MRLVIVGAGEQGHVALDVLRCQGAHEAVGWLDPGHRPGEVFLGLPVLGSDADAGRLAASHAIDGAFVALGDNWVRSRVVHEIQRLSPAWQFPSLIHPRAVLAGDVALGAGVLVVAGAVVNPGASIGNHSIINTLASVDHDCQLADFVSVAPHACLCGRVTVGVGTAICAGATVVHGLHIGAHTVVGAGSLVLKDVSDSVTAFGSPARVVRSRQPGDRYL